MPQPLGSVPTTKMGETPAETPASSEVDLLKQKMSKFGVLGAGVVLDSGAALAAAKAADDRRNSPSPGAELNALCAEIESDLKVTDDTTVAKADAGGPREPTLLEAEKVIAVLRDTVDRQDMSQMAINDVAHEIAEEIKDLGAKDIAKACALEKVYERLADIDIPENVLAECGVDEVDLNFSCQKYAEEDENEEVQKLLNGLYMPGTYMNEENEKLKNERLDEKLVDEFDTKRVKALHEFMIKDLQRICKEFVSMPEEERWKYCPIRLEKAVEAIVAVKVEKEYGYRSEVVEAAMNKLEEGMKDDQEFMAYNEQIAALISGLMTYTRPRVTKSEFMDLLQVMQKERRRAQALMKGLAALRKSGRWTWAIGYEKLLKIRNASSKVQEQNAHADMDPIELRTVFQSYAQDPECVTKWNESGADVSTSFALLCQSGGQITPQQMQMGPAGIPFLNSARANVTPEKLVECQKCMTEVLVGFKDELLKEDQELLKTFSPAMLLQLVQGLASHFVDEKHNISGEELAVAGFQQAMVLGNDKGFIESTMAQQKILQELCMLCGAQDGEGCSVM